MIQLTSLDKSFGDRTLLEDVSWQIGQRDRVGLCGPNGAGKTTLLCMLCGLEEPDAGTIARPTTLTVGYLPQDGLGHEGRTLVEEATAAFQPLLDLKAEMHSLEEQLGEPGISEAEGERRLWRYSELQDAFRNQDGYTIDLKVATVLQGLGFDRSEFDRPTETFSGGWQMRIALAKLLLGQPNLLLLDEPTNHLDVESVAWLERHLQEYPGTVVAITHDRYFLDNAAEWILELDRGRGIPWKGNYSSWLEQKQKRLAVEEKQASARQRTLEHELEWVRMAPRARQAKSKARLRAYEELASREEQGVAGTAEIAVPPGPRLGELVVEAEGLRKGFGDRLLVDDLNFRLPRGGIVGVIGGNGAGKSTLFRMIVGEEKADGGSLRLGDTVVLACVDQSRDALDSERRVWEVITGGEERIRVGKREVNARSYVGSFGFRGADQQKLVGQLSGGERNRVHLARTLLAGGNVLLLDEPTNDLDVDTLRALEDALLNFSGCAVVISHDRWFLDRIATHILAFEGDSHVEWFEGNYQDYEKDRRRRLGEAADRPSRLRYRRMVAP